jgi:hypothetical protein
MYQARPRTVAFAKRKTIGFTRGGWGGFEQGRAGPRGLLELRGSVLFGFRAYRGTSLIRNSPCLLPTVGLCLGPYGGPRGRGQFLMSEVPL